MFLISALSGRIFLSETKHDSMGHDAHELGKTGESDIIF